MEAYKNGAVQHRSWLVLYLSGLQVNRALAQSNTKQPWSFRNWRVMKATQNGISARRQREGDSVFQTRAPSRRAGLSASRKSQSVSASAFSFTIVNCASDGYAHTGHLTGVPTGSTKNIPLQFVTSTPFCLAEISNSAKA